MGAPASAAGKDNLRLLVCPVCHCSLRPEAEAIRCTGCSRRYPLVDGIPVLIESRATLG